ncbi:hypothetical protein GCM10025859_24920 [Alicyclobacillus fastidiosus]|nr:hypothetical protein GCM10025859_24920 [Alicyclobacillus fastidiosus]
MLEAAEVDGAGYFRTYWQIVLPLARPPLTTVAVFTFLWNRTDFLAPLIYINKVRFICEHHSGLNFNLNDLHPGARYCLGALKAENRFAGLDTSFDGALLIGYHGMGGTKNAIRDHTSTHWQYVTLNGSPIGEIGLDSLLFGLKGVPVLLVTGDEKTCQEASTELGEHVHTYVTKVGFGRHAGLVAAPRKIYVDYGTVIQQAIQNRLQCKPYVMQGPYELMIHFSSEHFDGL